MFWYEHWPDISCGISVSVTFSDNYWPNIWHIFWHIQMGAPIPPRIVVHRAWADRRTDITWVAMTLRPDTMRHHTVNTQARYGQYTHIYTVYIIYTLYIYIHTVHICVYILSIYIYIYICIYIYIHTVHIYIYMYVCIHTCISIPYMIYYVYASSPVLPCNLLLPPRRKCCTCSSILSTPNSEIFCGQDWTAGDPLAYNHSYRTIAAEPWL